MKQEVIKVVKLALENLKAEWGLEVIPVIEVEIPKNESLGDIATPLAMTLTKILKKPPRKIAEELLPKIIEQGGPFEKIEIAGAGFINFRFKNDYLYQGLEKLLKEEHSFLRVDVGKGKRIQIEFVSANPTGPLHIGHGRGAAVGNALSNLLKRAGFEVQREYYINDAGVQVRLLGQSVYARYQQMQGNNIPFPEDGYKGDYIDSISEGIIRRVGTKYLNMSFKECGDFFTNYSYKTMLADIANDLRDFGITFDRWQSEKELYQRAEDKGQSLHATRRGEKSEVEDSIDKLREKGYIYEKEGAVWFCSTKFGDDKNRVVVKRDGDYTYFASDIAYHKYKLDRGFDTIIDIWGADHHGYIPRVRSVLKAFGFPEEKFKAILIQMVTLLRHGKPVQMSKRAGEFIALREVIDEVGADTTKFIFLTRRPESHLEFDLEVAKEQSAENPVFYVQYAFARISSIFRQAMETGSRDQDTDVSEVDLTVLKEEDEISIIKKLLQYPMVFKEAVLSFEPHRITYYLQELAKLFHSYYNKYRVISEDGDLTVARLCLCKAVQIVLEEGLDILGVSAPERM